MTGRGIDRHLLGLRYILSDEWTWLDDNIEIGQDSSSQDTVFAGKAASQTISTSETTVPLFEDAIFKKSREWGTEHAYDHGDLFGSMNAFVGPTTPISMVTR